jgi:hypothetical protein
MNDIFLPTEQVEKEMMIFIILEMAKMTLGL